MYWWILKFYSYVRHAKPPSDSVVKNPPANVGDMGSIPGCRRSPAEGNGNLLQYSCLGNPMHREAWWATVHGIADESDVTQRLNNNMYIYRANMKVRCEAK